MKVALCGESREFKSYIHKLCTQFFLQEDIVVEIDNFSSGQALLEAAFPYDLVLLDMDIPGLAGLEIGFALGKKPQKTEIICVTSLAEYAIDGHPVPAFSYLLKCDLDQTFETCMTRVMEKIKAKARRRSFKFVEGHKSILLDELVYVESQATKLMFHICPLGDTQETVYHLYGKINDIQNNILMPGFIRTNQSYLINSAYIRKVKCYYTELANGEILSIPKVRYRQVKEQYALYLGGCS